MSDLRTIRNASSHEARRMNDVAMVHSYVRREAPRRSDLARLMKTNRDAHLMYQFYMNTGRNTGHIDGNNNDNHYQNNNPV